MTNVLADTIRANIEAKIKELGWDQSRLADESGVRQSTLSKFLNKHSTNPQINTLVDVAKGLGITVSDLTGENEWPREEAPLPGPIVYLKRFYGIDDDAAVKIRGMIDSMLSWRSMFERRQRSA